mgnify:CR=1 FL=1
MLDILIVEDSDRDAAVLEEYLARYAAETGVQIHAERCTQAVSLLENYRARYAVIFMDIELPLMNGMEAARKLRELDRTVILIFITNMAQFACEGYGVDALDFVVKPVSYPDFRMKFSRAVSRIDAAAEREYTIRVAGGVRRVRLQDIRYVEVDRHAVLYHLEGEVVESRDTLAAVEERLRPAHFLRCAKSFLVNPRYITRVEGSEIRLGDEVVYISGNRRKAFLQEFAAWMSGRG